MSSAPVPRLRRRTLSALLAVTSAGVSLAGCSSPSPVPTSADVARDPMAGLDPANWDARSAEEMRSLPVQGDAAELSTWGDLGDDESVLDPARDMLMTFLGVAYLDPDALHGLEDAQAKDRLLAVTPEFWKDTLRESWDDGVRHLHAFTLAEPFRTVGRPWICADWHRAERDDAPVLALGCMVSWTVIDPTTRTVGVLAYQFSAILELNAQGEAIEGAFLVVVHGLDICLTDEQGGLVAPALGDGERHRAAQKAALENVLTDPRIPLETVLDEEDSLWMGNPQTYVSECG